MFLFHLNFISLLKALETVNKQQNDELERIKEICECIIRLINSNF